MNRPPRRLLPIVLAALMLNLSPIAQAADDGSVQDVADGQPTVGQAYGDAMSIVQRQVADLERILAESGIERPEAESMAATPALSDDFDAARVGGVGDWRAGPHWRLADGIGRSGRAWTMMNATGRYETMDSMLVTPAIDLSAYAVAQVPFVNFANSDAPQAAIDATVAPCVTAVASIDRALTAACVNAATTVAMPNVLQQLIVLSFEHRFQLKQGIDGAQVILFTRDPATHPDLPGTVLTPMAAADADVLQTTLERIETGRGSGFSGQRFTGDSHGWAQARFDLTPWMTQTVWIGFRVETSEGASKLPNYHKEFDPSAPTGWVIDDVEVVAPAFASDVKLYSLRGPTYRLDAKDRIDRAAPGENITVTATVLHPAAASERVRFVARIDGAANGSFEEVIERTLAPGETWLVPIALTMPEEGATVRIDASVLPLAARTAQTTPDATPRNNEQSVVLGSTAVRRFDLSVVATPQMADVGDALEIRATVSNVGNVPLTVELEANDTATGENATVLARRNASLAPGETRTVVWAIGSATRGVHEAKVVARAPGASAVERAERYYVHVSPPPIFHEPGPTNATHWETAVATLPIPLDGSMWVARPANGAAGVTTPTVLVASPAPDLPQDARFTDLRIEARSSGVRSGPATLELTYPMPVAIGPVEPSAVWTGTLAHSNVRLNQGFNIDVDQNLTWHRSSIPVVPTPQSLYVDVWAIKGLQLRVRADITSGIDNSSSFFLDDLRLTGVPEGKDEAFRVEIIRITGEQEDQAEPAAPSICRWDNAAQRAVNCWRRMDEEMARSLAGGQSRWTNATSTGPVTLEGEPAAFGHFALATNGGPARDSDRLTTPPLKLDGASDPLLTFEHWYEFPGRPDDRNDEPAYAIAHVGYVELQYRESDGNWSAFVPIFPEGGYPASGIERSPSGQERQANAGGYAAGDGFFYPSRCQFLTGSCTNQGLTLWNFLTSHTREKVGVAYPKQPPELASYRLAAQPLLQGVDLSDAEVRLGFRVAGAYQETGAMYDPPRWIVRDIRLTPVSVFAMDGATTDVRLDVPYDWKRIGIGPGTTVTINVTATNAGRYAMPFVVEVAASRLGGSLAMPPVERSIGILQPGETKNVPVEWQVPAVDDVVYRIDARVRPSGEGDVDENDLNDVATLGLDGSLVAKRKVDLMVSAAVLPETGSDGRPRYVPIRLHNIGNVPLTEVRITRTFELLDRGVVTPQAVATIDLAATIPPDPAGKRFEELGPTFDGREFTILDSFLTPPEQGTYFVTIRAEAAEGDDAPSDNYFRGRLVAAGAIYGETWEAGGEWVAEGTSAWTTGPGFRSRSGALAIDPETGTLPAATDASLESATIPLAAARSANLNLFVKYDLEDRYDGARLEASADGGETWIPIEPKDGYPASLVASNPLGWGLSPDEPIQAWSGDSRNAPVHLDGWVSESFDLANVPGLGEVAVFETLDAPTPSLSPVASAPGAQGTYLAPWMRVDPLDPYQQWEIRNATEGKTARAGQMWWSGPAESTPLGSTRILRRDISLATAGIDGNTTTTLSWWEMRAGTTGSSWEGVGGAYQLTLRQPDDKGVYVALTEQPRLAVVERSGPWSRIEATIHEVDVSRLLRVEFSFYSYNVSIANHGWAIEDVVLTVARIDNGTRVERSRLMGDDDSASGVSAWQAVPSSGWRRAAAIPSRPVPWSVVPATTPDGIAGQAWKLSLPKDDTSLDGRLVTPVVDLSTSTSSEVFVDLYHRYDLLAYEGGLTASGHPWMQQNYQGGTVEIQAYNATTGEWDPWRQLWSDARPTTEMAKRPGGPLAVPMDGTPYNLTLPDAGDTFERFPRSYYRVIGIVGGLNYFYVPVTANVSYVFSNRSRDDGPHGYTVDRFDLSPYAGTRVRLAFHAFAGAIDAHSAIRHWTIGKVEFGGQVLSSSDILLRSRVATDNSTLQGSFAWDQLEVAGIANKRSVSIVLDEQPTRVDDEELVRITGRIRNHAPAARGPLGVGLVNDSFASSSVLVGGTSALGAGSRYATVATFPGLEPAGMPGSEKNFTIALRAGATPTTRRMVVEIVEPAAQPDGTITYSRAEDDVPGRARREWSLTVAEVRAFDVSPPTFEPSWRAAPGPVTVTARVTNLGTVPGAPVVRPSWTDEWGRSLPAIDEIKLPTLAPGDSHEFNLTATLPSTGNYTFEAQVTGAALVARATYRLARTDVAYVTSFEAPTLDAANWSHSPEGAFRSSTDTAAFGERSVLFGRNDTEFEQGVTEDTVLHTSGRLASDPIWLGHVQRDATLVYWQKRSFGLSGNVTTAGVVAGSCAAPLRTEGGVSGAWEIRELALAADCGQQPLVPDRPQTANLRSNRYNVTLTFEIDDMKGQGWRLDGLAVVSGRPTLSPEAVHFPITDSATKDYPFLLTNPGLAPRTFDLAIDDERSLLSARQRGWITVQPTTVTIGPGESALVNVRVESPAARGAFPQQLTAVLVARDRDAPFVPVSASLGLSFRPLPRSDLSATLSADGLAVLAGRGLEEGVPHELAASIVNVGVDRAPPVAVQLAVIDDGSGETLWTMREEIPALEPYADGGEAVVVSAPWKPDFGRRGNHTLRVTVDPDRIAVDYDRSNDNFEVPIVVTRLMRPDLVVDRKDVSLRTPNGFPLHEAIPGQLVQLSAAVQNDGPAAANGVLVRIYAGASILREHAVGTLAPGARVVVTATAFAPENGTTYRVAAYTPDLELSTSNNEQGATLPVFPPEIAFSAFERTVTIDPGVAQSVVVDVTNGAPYPTMLDLTLLGAGGFAAVEPSRIALGPNETRPVTVRFSPSPIELSRDSTVALRAVAATGQEAQRTLPYIVAARPSAEATTTLAEGTPRSLRVHYEVANTGNVPLVGDAVLLDASGKEIGRAPVGAVEPGRTGLGTMEVALPSSTPPGALGATLAFEEAVGLVAKMPIVLDVASWGEANVVASSAAREGAVMRVPLKVAFDGNAPSLREPRVYGLPAGASATFEPATLRVAPGEEADMSLIVRLPAQVKPGLYVPYVALIEKGARSAPELASMTPVSLDLRAARLTLLTAERVGDETIVSGDRVTYEVMIRNDGDAPAAGVPLELFVDGRLVGVASVDAAPGTKTKHKLSWEAVAGTHAVVIGIDLHGAHAGDSEAFGESLHVDEGGLIRGVEDSVQSAAQEVPLPAVPLVLLSLVAAALWRWRRRAA